MVMNKRLLLVLVLVLMLTAVPATSALAAPLFDGGQTVGSGETINNDVILFNGDLAIEAGGVVNGNVILFNGSAEVSGAVQGDLVLFNGDLDATETAVVTGECVVLNGRINDGSASGLGCTNVGGLPDIAALNAIPGSLPAAFSDGPGRHMRPADSGGSFVGGLFGVIGRSLLFGLLAFAAAAAAPAHLAQAQQTARHKTMASGAVGFLTAVAVPSLAAILTLISIVLLLVCIGIVGFALVFAIMAALAVATLFGWIVMGSVLGRWLASKLDRSMSAPLTAALGTFLLTFGLGFFGLIPFVFGEGLVTMIMLFVGLGAVTLTKFGTQPYPLTGEATPPGVKEDAAKITAVLNTLPDEE
jgi:hypothetical protein